MSNTEQEVKSSNIDVVVKERLQSNRGMSASRRVSDNFKKFFTYLSSILAVFVLGSVIFFIFQRGFSKLNWELITSDYQNHPYSMNLDVTDAGEFTRPDSLLEGAVFSEKFGFAVSDNRDAGGEKIVEVVYVDDKSPLKHGKTAEGKEISLMVGSDITQGHFLKEDGRASIFGAKDAESLVSKLEEKAFGIKDISFNTPGGGIRGSIFATLMLMVVTLLITLPLGVFTAIYLHEIALDNTLTRAIRSAVEMLNGVPSIIYGLMGMTVLFPITRLFGATTPNVLLGGLTMAIVLLPVVIRQTEEALITVPTSLRMGSLALGATRTQTIFRVVLPNALPGILSAGLLSISRVIGESAALIYTMGTAISDFPEWNKGATTLAVQIWSVMSGEQPNIELASAISILILIVVLILNITVRVITKQINKKWE